MQFFVVIIFCVFGNIKEAVVRVGLLREVIMRSLLVLKGICHPSAHVQQFDFLSDGTVFKVDSCERNPTPSAL